MARITTSSGTVTVELTTVEKLASLGGDVTVARDRVAGVRVSDDPFRDIKGIRAPGAAWPRRFAIGRWRYRGGTDFVSVRRGERGVVIDLADGGPYRRLVVGVDDPEKVAAALS